MMRRSFLLVLCFIVGALLASCVRATPTPSPAQTVTPTPTLTSSPTPAHTVVPTTSVSIEPASVEVGTGEQFTAVMKVNPVGKGVSAGEINLSFDPQAMQVVEVKPGDLLGERPLPGILNIDNEAGTVSYSLARIGETTPPTSGAPFAVITFQILKSAQPGDYNLSFTGVGLANENFEDIRDIQVTGAGIKIKT